MKRFSASLIIREMQIKTTVRGLPWWSGGKDSILSLHGAQVQFLIWEQRSHRCGQKRATKKKKPHTKKNTKQTDKKKTHTHTHKKRATVRYHLTQIRMAIIKKPINNKCWRRY